MASCSLLSATKFRTADGSSRCLPHTTLHDVTTIFRYRIQSKCLDIQFKIYGTDVKGATITEEITKFSFKYRDKITTHPNELACTLLEEEEPRRPRRFKPTDLTTRFS
jgi:hypothetical protein